MTYKELAEKFLGRDMGVDFGHGQYPSDMKCSTNEFLGALEKLLKQVADDALDKATLIVRTNHILSNPIGPLYGAGWEAAIDMAADLIQSLK